MPLVLYSHGAQVSVTREPAIVCLVTRHRSPSIRAYQYSCTKTPIIVHELGKFGHSSTKQAQSVLEPESKHVASQIMAISPPRAG